MTSPTPGQPGQPGQSSQPTAPHPDTPDQGSKPAEDPQAPQGAQYAPSAQAPQQRTGSSFAHKVADKVDQASDAAGAAMAADAKSAKAAAAGQAHGAGQQQPGRPTPRDQRPGGAAAGAANPRTAPGLKGQAAAQGSPAASADERIANAAGRTAFDAAAAYSGVSETAAAVPGGKKALEIGRKVTGKATQLQYSMAKKAIGSVIAAVLLLGSMLFGIALLPVLSPGPDTNICANDIYNSNTTVLPKDLTKSQKEVVSDIVTAAINANMGLNTAAFAIYVAYYEHGLQNKGTQSLRDEGIGAFQQNTSWFATDVAKDPSLERLFHTDADPRLNVQAAATKFMQAFRTMMKENKGVSHHEPQAATLAALAQLGVDTTDPDRIWAKWKNADLSATLTNPDNAVAAMTVAHAVQGFADASVTSNPVRKFPKAIAYMAPVLTATKNKSEAAYVNSLAVAGRGLLAEQVTAPGSEVDGLGNSSADSQDPKTSGVFVLGDSLTAGIRDDLEDAGYTVDAQVGRRAGMDAWEPLRGLKAQAAATWIIELGTNNAGNQASIDDVSGWIRAVKNARNKYSPQKVYWVLPWRPSNFDDYLPRGATKLGDATGLAAEIDRIANGTTGLRADGQADYKNAWLVTLDWPSLAAIGDQEQPTGWFDEDDTHVHPNDDGDDALRALMLSVGDAQAASDSVYATCVGGSADGLTADGLDPTTIAQGRFFQEDTGFFTDGPSAPDAGDWVPNVLARARAATVNPPCTQLGCPHQCGQLSARVHGVAHSMSDSAWAQWLAFAKLNLTTSYVQGSDPATSPALRPPVGAMLFWAPTSTNKAGHVATYVGGGRVVSNDKIGDTPVVVIRSADYYYQHYGQYLGWSWPPDSWKPAQATGLRSA